MPQKSTDARVQEVFSADRVWAGGAICVLWCLYAFTFWEISVSQSEHGVLFALALAGSLVLLFNTASIITMIVHYSQDKDQIYRLDIHYLDEMKRARG